MHATIFLLTSSAAAIALPGCASHQARSSVKSWVSDLDTLQEARKISPRADARVFRAGASDSADFSDLVPFARIRSEASPFEPRGAVREIARRGKELGADVVMILSSESATQSTDASDLEWDWEWDDECYISLNAPAVVVVSECIALRMAPGTLGILTDFEGAVTEVNNESGVDAGLSVGDRVASIDGVPYALPGRSIALDRWRLKAAPGDQAVLIWSRQDGSIGEGVVDILPSVPNYLRRTDLVREAAKQQEREERNVSMGFSPPS